MDNEKLLQSLSDMIDNKLEPIHQRLDHMDNRFDQMDSRLDQVDSRFDQMDNRLNILEVKQNKMAEQLTELQLSQKYFELNTNKKLAKLEDGIDAIVEILKINELIPR